MSKFNVLSRIQHDGQEFAAGDTFEGEDAVTRPLVDAGVLEAVRSKGEKPAETAPEVPEAGEGGKTDGEVKPAAKAARAASEKAQGKKPAGK